MAMPRFAVKPLLRAGAFALLAMMLSAAAPQPAQYNRLDMIIRDYVDAKGWLRTDTQSAEAKWRQSLQALDGRRSDGMFGPIEKALLMFDVMEGASSFARTALSYGQMTLDDNGLPRTISFVEVRRYDLARAPAAQSEGQEAYVARRFVFMPLPDDAAVLIESSRRAIPETEALRDTCIRTLCLQTDVSLDTLGPFAEEEPPSGLDWPSPYQARAGQIAITARAAAELCAAMGFSQFSDGIYRWIGMNQPQAAQSGEPFLFIVLDANHSGTAYSKAVLALTQIEDGQAAEYWKFRGEEAGQVYWRAASISRH